VPEEPAEEQPLVGTSEEFVEAVRGIARDGISHLQLVLDPSMAASLDTPAPALDLLDRARRSSYQLLGSAG
jgi:hypothetical protein